MSDPRGFSIAVESFESSNPPMRLFAEHLASNLALHIASEGYPNLPVSLLCGMPSPRSDVVLPDGARGLVFDVTDGFLAPYRIATHEVSEGKIIVTDRFLHHIDQALPEAHLSLPVEEFLLEEDVQADCLLYIVSEGSVPDSEFARHVHARILSLAESNPRVMILPLAADHAETCDAVWKHVERCFNIWLSQRFPKE